MLKSIDEEKLSLNANKYLIYFYALSCSFGLVTCIFAALALSHWHSTLNTCVDSDCGCIFYVLTTWNVINGGDIRICYYITYTHLIVFLLSLGMAIYYCIQSVYDENRRKKIMSKNRRDVQCSQRPDDERDSWFTLIALLSGVVAVVLLSTAYMSTEGYYKTCREYRRTVAKNLKASGNLVSLIYDRISCSTVLDIMDYTQPNARGREPRGGTIDTPFLLQGAIISAWLHFLVWLMLLFYNGLLARRKIQKRIEEASSRIRVRTETSI